MKTLRRSIRPGRPGEPAAVPSDESPADGHASASGPAPAAAGDETAVVDLADLELEGEIAADYVEGLLDVADLDGDIDMDVEGDRALVSVVGATLDELVGPRGEVLEALQELTRLAVHRQTGARTRIMLDVGGYRQRRRAELTETGRVAAEEVRRTGVAKKLWRDEPVRAEGRARRGGRGRAAERVRGRGAGSPRGRAAGRARSSGTARSAQAWVVWPRQTRPWAAACGWRPGLPPGESGA